MGFVGTFEQSKARTYYSEGPVLYTVGIYRRSMLSIIFLTWEQLIKFPLANTKYTDKETDESWEIFIIWKINFGLWAMGWAGLWKKKVWADYEQLLRPVFMGKLLFILFWKYCRVHTEKLHKIKVYKSQKLLGSIFYSGKTSFFKAKNLSVSTKTLWSVLCLLLLWSKRR